MAIAVEPALSPHLVVDDAAAAIDFYVKALMPKSSGESLTPTAS
jgi:PhnB protein